MPEKSSSLEWIPDLANFLSRRWRLVGTTAGIVLALAVLYMCVASQKYTATTTLLIDTQAAASFQTQTQLTDAEYANGIVESQVEVLESDGLARAVVRRLHLAGDKEFLKNGHSIIGSVLGPIMGLFSSGGPDNAAARETAAAELLGRMIKVKRSGLSFIINMDVRTLDPNLSAKLANTLAEEYVEMGLAAKSGNTKRASDWLQARIGGLHDQAIAADKAAQVFKAKAHIVDTEKGLMNERHLGDLNSQLVLARSRTADAKAKYERAAAILNSGDVTGNVTDALQNLVVIHLREAYVDAANQAAQWRAKYGPNHQAVKLMEGHMRDIQNQLTGELRRITAGYQSDYQEAQASEQDIAKQLQQLSGDASAVNADLVTLRALQSSADTYRNLYENFLQRYTQAVQDQSFPISEARIVTVAMPPLRPSWPKPLIVLAAGAVLGLGFGFALALVLDSLDRGLRTASQVRAALGLNCLGLLPTVPQPRDHARITARAFLTTAYARLRQVIARGPAALVRGERPAVAGREAPAMSGRDPSLPRSVAQGPAIMRHAANMPLSAYGEAVRGLRIRMIQQRDGKRPAAVVGCVSILPGEGKSTVAASFAFFLAKAGFKTLLLDWDMRKPTLSQALTPGAPAGFADVARGDVPLSEALWQDKQTGLHVLPLGSGDVHLDLLEDEATVQLVKSLRDRYDHIIIDLPAMEAVSDAQIAAQLVDGLLLIVKWGRTPQDQVLEWLNSGGIDERNILGVILNQVDLKMLPSYPVDTGTFGVRRRATVA
jgi:succinoglycan biosynthesis transport protein ExoP